VKNGVGILLWLVGLIVGLLTLVAALIYAVSAVVWMHAPLLDVLQVTGEMALLPLGLAWLCITIGRRMRVAAPAAARSPVKRWVLACIGITMIIACTTLVRTGLTEYQCSVDRSRNATKHEAETIKNGFERVCEGDLARFDIRFRPLEAATRRLAFTPVDLTHTPFAQLESLGGRTEYVDDVPSRLYRGFRTSDGHRLTLFEQDMSADGSSSWRHPKDEPERINGLPARLVIMEDTSGTAVSLLSWVEGRRDYQLWINANVVHEPRRDRLFALASSLPHAVPACPNEAPPKQIRFAPDGHPVEEPMPKLLSKTQVEVLLDKSKRPCK
jgi:hypothetical protein